MKVQDCKVGPDDLYLASTQYVSTVSFTEWKENDTEDVGDVNKGKDLVKFTFCLWHCMMT